jgi:hypothetical protein
MITKEHLCLLCPVYGQEAVHFEYPHVCFPCRSRMKRHLEGIAEQWLMLDPTPSGSAGERISGSREAPIGARVDVLDQILAVSPFAEEMIHDPFRDQIGERPAAAVLDAIAKEWLDVRRSRGLKEHRPVPTVVNLTAWLSDRLDWACERLPDSIGDNADEIRSLCGRLHALNGNSRSRDPEPLPATPCKKCGHIALVSVEGQVVCTNCSQYSGPFADAMTEAITRITDAQAA